MDSLANPSPSVCHTPLPFRYVTSAMVSEWMPSPSLGQSALVLVCGPPAMMRAISGDKNPDKSQGVLAGVLKGAGYTEEQVYKF